MGFKKEASRGNPQLTIRPCVYGGACRSDACGSRESWGTAKRRAATGGLLEGLGGARGVSRRSGEAQVAGWAGLSCRRLGRPAIRAQLETKPDLESWEKRIGGGSLLCQLPVWQTRWKSGLTVWRP